MSQKVDYDALAKKFGAVQETPDYNALAKKFGAVEEPPPNKLKQDMQADNTPWLSRKIESFLGPIRESLEPKPGEGTVTRAVKGPVRALFGIGSMPLEILKTGATPISKEEIRDPLFYLSGGNRVVKRMILDPARETMKQSIRSFREGRQLRGTFQAGASLIPMVGPYADSLIERGKQGDVAGAVSEGVASFGVPTGLKWGGTLSAKLGSKILGGGKARMAQTPQFGGPVIQSGSRADVAKFAQSKGIDLLPGQATGARPLQAIQSVAERSLAGDPIDTHIKWQHANLAREVENFKKQMKPDAELFPERNVDIEMPLDRETIGADLKQQVQTRMEEVKKSAQDLFEDWTFRAGRHPLDTSITSQKYSQRLKQMDTALKNLPEKFSKPIREILEKASRFGTEILAADVNPKEVVIGGRKFTQAELSPEMWESAKKNMPIKPVKSIKPEITVSDASQLRSAFWEIAHDYEGNIPKRVNAIAAEIVQDLDGLMEQAAKETGTLDTWRHANTLWKSLEEIFNTNKSPLFRILQEADPSKATTKITMKGDIGGSPRAVRMAKNNGVDLSFVKRQVIQDIAERGFNLGQHGGFQLGGFSHDFLTELFSPVELKELYMIGEVARAIKFEMNPSGTSNVLIARDELKPWAAVKTFLGAAPGSIAKRITLNPSFRKATTGLPPLAFAKPKKLKKLKKLMPTSGIPTSGKIAAAAGSGQNRLRRDMMNQK